jgi:hypothetical protein
MTVEERDMEQMKLPLGSDSVPEPGSLPPVPSEEADAANTEQPEPPVQRASQSTRLVALAGDVELFHSPDRTGFARMPIKGHRETWPLKSRSFRRYVVRRFYDNEGIAPNAQALKDAIEVFEARAQFEGKEEPVFVRVGELDGSLWLDLGDPDWRAIEIRVSGWHVVANPPVRFRRSMGMRPLPNPVKGGTVGELRPFINIASDEDWTLILSWIVAAMRPRGPYPILNLHGEQGTAKSTFVRVVRDLVDPNCSPLRTTPRDERDLQITAKSSHVIVIDNMSRLEPWLSDALCRLATGGGLATRQLFTDEEEVFFDAQRPILLNGIENVGTRGDYLERSIVLHLAPIPETSRRDEEEFGTAFKAACPRILGALLDAVSTALRMSESVRLARKPRMADFAKWSVAAEPGLGLSPGSFLKAYAGNRTEATALALEFSPLAPHICAFLDGKEKWTGTASELLSAIRSGRRYTVTANSLKRHDP